MTTEQIISLFELLVDDSTELSSTEELALLNRVYQRILSDRQWEFLKKEFTATTNGTNYLALPDDFIYFLATTGYTNNSMSNIDTSSPKAIYLAGSPIKMINWGDRRQYENSGGYCYVDTMNKRLYFCNTPTSGKTVSGDYLYKAEDLTTGESPVFSKHNEMIAYGMAIEDMAIQIFEKARSYAGEYMGEYQRYLTDLRYDNSQLILN